MKPDSQYMPKILSTGCKRWDLCTHFDCNVILSNENLYG